MENVFCENTDAWMPLLFVVYTYMSCSLGVIYLFSEIFVDLQKGTIIDIIDSIIR